MTKEDKGKSPKAKKTKESKGKEVEEVEAVPYEVRMKAVTVISKPMADEKKVCVSRAGCSVLDIFATATFQMLLAALSPLSSLVTSLPSSRDGPAQRK